MDFIKTKLEGCTLIRTIPHGDQRGYFARTFCANEFKEHGLNTTLAQASYSYNKRRGTVRGLHFQEVPVMEDKLVRCLRGTIFDIMVDIRPSSPTFGQWYGHELSETNNLQLHSTQGFAHGFQTLTDDCIVAYHIAQFYDPTKTSGIRWDDPDIGVAWPETPIDQSPRDLSLPFLSDIDHKILLNYSENKK
jgi:dTDP-4-dehydrorhamnose 3,5-epimerase